MDEDIEGDVWVIEKYLMLSSLSPEKPEASQGKQ